MGLPSNAEQELLALVNRFRADPAGEAERLLSGVGTDPGSGSDYMFIFALA